VIEAEMAVGRVVFGYNIRPKPDRHDLGQGPVLKSRLRVEI